MNRSAAAMAEPTTGKDTARYRQFDVPVVGGTLRVGQWGDSGPVVLACHGLTGNHVMFRSLADHLQGTVRVIAPDLRGRGHSNRLGGPWGLRAHADDVLAVLDHLGIEQVGVMAGHSMGGFVAAVVAALRPQRVRSVLMIDGGIPLMKLPPIHKLPFGNKLIDFLVRRITGPALERLKMTFPTSEAYHLFWRAHPAFKNEWSQYVGDFLDYDLVGHAPTLRPSTRMHAVLEDARQQLSEKVLEEALATLSRPVHFLRAPRGIMNEKPLYSVEKLKKRARAIPGFRLTDVEDVNHYTVLVSHRGGQAIAAEVHRMLAEYPA